MDYKMKRKIIIKADMKVLTGLHIGGSSAYSAIGTVDSPVIRSSYDKKPIVPGSSLKGKLRTLLASVKDTKEEYSDIKKDKAVIKRLFGSTDPIMVSRLQFADAYIGNFQDKNMSSLTEVKFENTIDRGTCVANPRQIERVVPGVVFETVIVYNELDEQETEEDIKTLAEGMRLLHILAPDSSRTVIMRNLERAALYSSRHSSGSSDTPNDAAYATRSCLSGKSVPRYWLWPKS